MGGGGFGNGQIWRVATQGSNFYYCCESAETFISFPLMKRNEAKKNLAKNNLHPQAGRWPGFLASRLHSDLKCIICLTASR